MGILTGTLLTGTLQGGGDSERDTIWEVGVLTVTPLEGEVGILTGTLERGGGSDRDTTRRWGF